MVHRPAAETIERVVESVEGFGSLAESEQERLRAMAAHLLERGLNPAFVVSALASTAGVIGDIQEEETALAEVLGRAEVRRFLEQHPPLDPATARQTPRREWKQVERERLAAHIQGLLRLARRAHAPHEAKKMRNRLLKIDQRHVRRVLGGEGDALCGEINGLLRGMASRF